MNQRKGWRKHQLDLDDIAQRIAAKRESSSLVFTEIVAGGGKSRNAVIFGDRLRKAGLIDKIIWVTPRLSLQRQGAEAAIAGVGDIDGFRLGEHHRVPGRDGFVTNYMALRSDPKAHFELLDYYSAKGKRVLLVADEIHYCSGKSGYIAPWAETFRDLAIKSRNANGHLLAMSGTVRRWDSNPVFRAPYPLAGVSSHLDPSRALLYGREAGIEESAITRIRVHSFDGYTQWMGEDGTPETPTPVLLSSVRSKQTGRAVRAFLHASNLEAVHMPAIMDAISCRLSGRPGWLKYRESYGNNQIIITVDRQKTAELIVKRLNSPAFRRWIRTHRRSDGSGPILADDFRAALAVSSSSDSLKSIEAFRHNRVHCLVTVAMAHVGMDAPSATHLVHLGDTRSIPWLTQLFARVWRTGDYEWPKDRFPIRPERRVAQIWAPADWRMSAASDAIVSGDYGMGQSKQQKEGNWSGILWDELLPLPPRKPKTKKGPQPQYRPVPGACRVSSFKGGILR